MGFEESPEEKRLLGRLGKMLIAISSEKQKSLERVAYEAGVSKGYIYDIAKGKANPSILILHRIASVLDVPVWKLTRSY
ncbi:MAG: helix-turn-helix transcriptional regulator [Deltaproteobacteria bacterium]|nr:helix-turn-helix transcriptional regulator [Deltaproteobacteria bacterium]